jgi:pseudouridine synthase
VAEAVRAQKAIANSGLMSRRAAEEVIASGRVAVDGQTIGLGDRVDVTAQVLTIDGSPIPLNPDLETHLLYKPVGVISSATDPHGRTVVVDLVRSERRLYPVGRLDSDSEGLILLTNDGELANRVTHPRYEITKKYVALVAGRPSATEVRRLTTGVELSDGPARAMSARIIRESGNEIMVELVLGEGRNREVRRMFEAIGYEVVRLVRTAIGPISDQTLKAGESRLLSIAEINRLRASGTTNP